MHAFHDSVADGFGRNSISEVIFPSFKLNAATTVILSPQTVHRLIDVWKLFGKSAPNVTRLQLARNVIGTLVELSTTSPPPQEHVCGFTSMHFGGHCTFLAAGREDGKKSMQLKRLFC